MKPVWKLSMGTWASGNEFPNLAAVTVRTDAGYVLVRGPTGRKGRSRYTQGQLFRRAGDDDLFYLCHGNQTPGVLLIGRFTGPAEPDTPRYPGYRASWLRRPFETLATHVSTARYTADDRWWAPSHNSTFVPVPPRDLKAFETDILKPYFKRDLKWLGQQ